MDVPAHPLPDGHYFGASSLSIFRPVELNGKRIGTNYVGTGLAGLSGKFLLFGVIALMVLLGWVSTITLTLVRRMRQAIVGAHSFPGRRGAANVAEREDYGARVRAVGNETELADWIPEEDGCMPMNFSQVMRNCCNV